MCLIVQSCSWYPEFSYFFSAIIVLVFSLLWNETSAPPLQEGYKLTTERNKHAQGSCPLGSGRIGPRSGYSVMPYNSQPDYQWDTARVSCSAKNAGDVFYVFYTIIQDAYDY